MSALGLLRLLTRVARVQVVPQGPGNGWVAQLRHRLDSIWRPLRSRRRPGDLVEGAGLPRRWSPKPSSNDARPRVPRASRAPTAAGPEQRERDRVDGHHGFAVLDESHPAGCRPGRRWSGPARSPAGVLLDLQHLLRRDVHFLGRIQRELLQDLGREPTPEELAKEMDITPEKVLEIQQYAREPISLDQTIGDEGDSQLGDFIEDSEAGWWPSTRSRSRCCRTSCSRCSRRSRNARPAWYGCASASPTGNPAPSTRSARSTA